MNWSKERLQYVIRSCLEGMDLIVVANREPYIHVQRDGRIDCQRPAGGLTTALDPVMRACGGTWIGHGSGSADRLTADEHGRLAVPPEAPSYTLRRIWLTEEEEEGYYYGFANNALWPLCHQAYCRPEFDPDHWETYRAVNQRFAEAVLEEAGERPALVFVQDYHFALLPRLLKLARPDLLVAQFWHIPWPNPETFRVCPWADAILDGMLGNDLMSFHTRYDCNNFRDTVERSLECLVDAEHFTIHRNGQATRLRPHPISIDPDLAAVHLRNDWHHRVGELRRQWNMGDRPFLVSVDRMDYTKGIPERLRAFERLLQRYPNLLGRFHLVMIAAPSRTHLPAYQRLDAEVMLLVHEINQRYGTADWQPIVFRHEHHGPEVIYPLYRASVGCVVSSLHDGMNLVAKEFVSSREDEQGTLVLSRFTGAAREFLDALIVNPFDVDQLADAMYAALTLPVEEQRRRMQRMRQQLSEHNIYRWAGRLISEAARRNGSPEPMTNRLATTVYANGSTENGHASHAPLPLGTTTVAMAMTETNGAAVQELPWYDRALTAWRSGQGLALFFDYDGTLSPIVPHPELAVLTPQSRQLLRDLSGQGGVIVGVVSGRSLADLRERVGLSGLYYAGCCGGELDLRGRVLRDPVAGRFQGMSEHIQEVVGKHLTHYPGAWVEVKPVGLSIHYRAVDPAVVETFRQECRALLATVPGLLVRDVKMAFEATPVGAWNKGTAIERFLADAGGDWFPVYAGDSDNDRPALEVVAWLGGTRLGVGEDCPDCIDFRVESPGELVHNYLHLLTQLGELPEPHT